MIHRHQIHDALLKRGRWLAEKGELKDALELPKEERKKAMPRMSESVAMFVREFDSPWVEVYEGEYAMRWRRGR